MSAAFRARGARATNSLAGSTPPRAAILRSPRDSDVSRPQHARVGSAPAWSDRTEMRSNRSARRPAGSSASNASPSRARIEVYDRASAGRPAVRALPSPARISGVPRQARASPRRTSAPLRARRGDAPRRPSPGHARRPGARARSVRPRNRGRDRSRLDRRRRRRRHLRARATYRLLETSFAAGCVVAPCQYSERARLRPRRTLGAASSSPPRSSPY